MCKNHKKYGGQLPPKRDCIDCFAEYLEKNPNSTLFNRDLAKLLRLLVYDMKDIYSKCKKEY